MEEDEHVKVKFETLRAIDQAEHMDMEQHMPDRVSYFLLVLRIL